MAFPKLHETYTLDQLLELDDIEGIGLDYSGYREVRFTIENRKLKTVNSFGCGCGLCANPDRVAKIKYKLTVTRLPSVSDAEIVEAMEEMFLQRELQITSFIIRGKRVTLERISLAWENESRRRWKLRQEAAKPKGPIDDPEFA